MSFTFFSQAKNNLLKRKNISLINLLGLVLAFASFFLIMMYVHHERSFDKGHENYENIFRVRYQIVNQMDLVVCSPIVGPTFKKEIPEVKEYVRLLQDRNNIISYENIKFKERNVFYADSSIFKVFSFDILQGNPSNALTTPYSAVISDIIARKYFGDENPIGKTIKRNNLDAFTVTGVFKPFDNKSHIKIDILYSFNSGHWLSHDLFSWNRSFFYTYLLLNPGSDPGIVQSKFTTIAESHKIAVDEGAVWRFTLQPLSKIHLFSDSRAELETNGNGKIVSVLAIVAFVILILGWVNFVNLSVAMCMERAKEVGVKKVVGSNKFQLLKSFVFESLLLNVFAFLLALIFAIILSGVFNNLLGVSLSVRGLPRYFWFLAPGLMLLGATITSLYSGTVLASFNPVEVLKGKFVSSKRGNLERKLLLGFQYVISIALIVSAVVFYRQTNYMLKGELGVTIKDKIVLEGLKMTHADSISKGTIDAFKGELLKNPNIKGVCFTNSVPVLGGGYGVRLRLLEQSESESFMSGVMHVDADFIPNYEIELLHGENFKPGISNTGCVIISEDVAKRLGFDNTADAINKQIYRDYWSGTCKIVGIMKPAIRDFKRGGYPLMLHYGEKERGFVSININKNGDFSQILSNVKAHWETFFPGEVFYYHNLNEKYLELYKNEKQQARIICLFAVISILISSIGLIGLISLVIVQRSREVGLRKLLGQSRNAILFTLSKYFVSLNIIAALIALPLTYYLLGGWLKGFAHHVELSPVYGVLSISIILAITMTIITISTVKTLRTDPVKVLRQE